MGKGKGKPRKWLKVTLVKDGEIVGRAKVLDPRPFYCDAHNAESLDGSVAVPGRVSRKRARKIWERKTA